MLSARYREGLEGTKKVSDKFQNLFGALNFLDKINFEPKYFGANIFLEPGNFLIQNFFLNMAGQVSAGQVRAGQVRKGQVWTGQVRTSQVRTVQVRTEQVRIEQLRTGQVGTS